MADFNDGQIVRKPLECGDRHHGIVDAHGGRKVDWELKAADLAEEDGRERIASHPASVNGNRARNNVQAMRIKENPAGAGFGVAALSGGKVRAAMQLNVRGGERFHPMRPAGTGSRRAGGGPVWECATG